MLNCDEVALSKALSPIATLNLPEVFEVEVEIILLSALRPKLKLCATDDEAVIKFAPPKVKSCEVDGLRLRPTVPLLPTLNSVVVALCVDEPMAKSVVLVPPLFA